ncbi:alkaline phosphatase [Sphaerisporangium krabiense]|uniref:Alkaline phosphatase D n=1 Tax=Sphaerisporangium krabiense TaxID=763782 RepID=A0A7W9DUB8_9ACTN|nr:alkaline phosphatase D family protein [Sphaerisporangium krabiense]MBB5630864.1 alkaline phosphatase D [Sphaerisporangium krabiense]GII65452.1 alkaline phosphatase [Sphaerisporangium krabiense]
MIDRRSFLVLGLASGVPPLRVSYGDPFTLGVACGDPSPDGFVIWTRLAPAPLAEDGLGGMPAAPVPVYWEVATDPACARVVRRGTEEAVREWAHSVHAEVAGLEPGREYWYRFKAGTYVSPIGRALTAPPPASLPKALTLAVASCANYQHGHFTAYSRMAGEHPDLVLHLGDYIYEYGKGEMPCPGGNAREHEGPEARTLTGYRRRHALYKTDADLRAAHAAAPWVPIMDDHEVRNNWTSLLPAERREAAFRAYYEHMPLRRSSVPRGPMIKLFRRLRWGRLATIHMLDTRQYRDPLICGAGFEECPESREPGRTITGAEQERWLLEGFRESGALWDVIGQQVFFGQRDRGRGGEKLVRQDAWDGYSASRTRVTRGWLDAGVRNAVVLTGDVHSHWAGDLALDYDDDASTLVGTELAVTSVTSGGDGRDHDRAREALLAKNPHLKFHLRRRGYLMVKVEPTALVADFKVLKYVSTPGAPAHTAASFAVPDKIPGLLRRP